MFVEVAQEEKRAEKEKRCRKQHKGRKAKRARRSAADTSGDDDTSGSESISSSSESVFGEVCEASSRWWHMLGSSCLLLSRVSVCDGCLDLADVHGSARFVGGGGGGESRFRLAGS